MFHNFSTRTIMTFCDFLYNQCYVKLVIPRLEVGKIRLRSAFYQKPHNSLEPCQCYFRLNLSNMSSLDWHPVYSHSRTFWYDRLSILPQYSPFIGSSAALTRFEISFFKHSYCGGDKIWTSDPLVYCLPFGKERLPYFIRREFCNSVAIVVTESILA